MSLTKSRLEQAHSKASRAVEHLALALSQQKLGRMGLHSAINELNAACSLLKDILNAKN